MGERGMEAQANSHFSDEGKRLSVLTPRGSEHRDNTDSGFDSKETYRRAHWKPTYADQPYSEAHHIVCIDAVGSRYDEKKTGGSVEDEDKNYIEGCLWITDWNINNSDNMIGLPLRDTFKDGKVTQDLCCHQNEHNTAKGYTDECIKFLFGKIWSQLHAQRSDEHKFEPKDIASMLNKMSVHFRDQLKDRAEKRDLGAAKSWEQRETRPLTWYMPLSMADDSAMVPRFPGNVTIKNRMGAVFSRVN